MEGRCLPRMGLYVAYALGPRDDVRLGEACAFKLMPARALQSMTLTTRGAVISTEFLVLAHRQGLRIAEVAVSHRPRTVGRSRGGNVTVIVRALWELFKLRWRLLRG